MKTPNWKNAIDKTLEILKSSDKGIIMLDNNNNIVTPEKAAQNKISVTPYTALKFIQLQFSDLGLDISNKDIRIKLFALLEEYDRLQKLKVR